VFYVLHSDVGAKGFNKSESGSAYPRPWP